VLAEIPTDTVGEAGYQFSMGFAEVMEELPALTVAERQWLVRRALDLDGAELTAEDEALVEKRLAHHRLDPGSALPLDEMKVCLRARFSP